MVELSSKSYALFCKTVSSFNCFTSHHSVLRTMIPLPSKNAKLAIDKENFLPIISVIGKVPRHPKNAPPWRTVTMLEVT